MSTTTIAASNSHGRAIKIIKTDVHAKTNYIASSLTKIDHLDQREADELQTLKEIWENRRAAVLLMSQGANNGTTIG